MFIALVLITVVSSGVSLYYASAALKDSDKTETVYYAFVRSLAAALIVILVVVLYEKSLIYIAALLMGLIQLGDTYVGFHFSNKLKTYGPLSVAITSLVLLLVNVTK